MERRPLGAAGIEVSAISLGSWRTFERLSRAAGAAVMTKARECGIAFLDDARYDDETGTAPLKTGYSEVVFGELFRAAGWPREDMVVANKLWWEFWPRQTAVQEAEASLRRMGFEYFDLMYSFTLPDGLTVDEAVGQIGELLASGKVRAWGVANWRAPALADAVDAAQRHGIAPPCAAQLPYSLLHRDWVQDDAMAAALDAGGASVVASYVLEGGALTGKYSGSPSGRLADSLDDPAVARAARAGDELRALAAELGTTAAALAIAFTLADRRVASTLVGATSPGQVAENAASLDLVSRLSDGDLQRLSRIGA